MTEIITYLGEYALEIILGGLIVFFNIIGRPKSAEKIKKIKEKNLTQRERRQLKYIEKMKTNQIEIDKLKKEINKDA